MLLNLIGQTTPDYARTPEEVADGLFPAYTSFSPGDIRRYGKKPTNNVYTVNIPSDFPTLQKAIDHLSKRPEGWPTINLHIESGHALTDGVLVTDGDYGYFLITADDPLVTVDSTFPDNSCVVKAERAVAPVLDCLVDMNGRGDSGYVLNDASTGYVAENAGILNSGGNGDNAELTGIGLLVVRCSRCISRNSVFRGHLRNLWVSQASQCHADFSDLDDGTSDFGVYIARSSIATLSYSTIRNCNGRGLKVRRSLAIAMQAEITGNGQGGVSATDNAIVLISQGGPDGGGTIANNTGTGIEADNARVAAEHSDISGNTGNAVSALNGAVVFVADSDLSSDTRGINASQAIVEAARCTIAGCSQQGIFVAHGRVNAPSSTIDECNVGIEAQFGADVNASSSEITDSNLDGVRARDMSRIVLRAATITGSGDNDCEVNAGGQISLHGATTSSSMPEGTPNLADTNVSGFNVIDSNGRGIIWA